MNWSISMERQFRCGSSLWNPHDQNKLLENKGLQSLLQPDLPEKGGSALIMKENIKHYLDAKYETAELQVTTVQIKSKDMTVTVIYYPVWELQKKDYTHFYRSLGERFIIGGNFNTKQTFWGSTNITSKRRQLFAARKAMSCHFKSTGKLMY